MATRERRKFTPEFKREAVKLAEQLGRSLTAAARLMRANDAPAERFSRLGLAARPQ